MKNPELFQLNLFCCKDDRAELLIEQGFLVNEVRDKKVKVNDEPWIKLLSSFFYSKNYINNWMQVASKNIEKCDYLSALSFYAKAHRCKKNLMRMNFCY